MDKVLVSQNIIFFKVLWNERKYQLFSLKTNFYQIECDISGFFVNEWNLMKPNEIRIKNFSLIFSLKNVKSQERKK